ncbi:hypothetical protein ABZ929_21145 [Streptomyces physcomitrii]|uniref:hypothetical protein n=1 Tax=Streptomyces physcomitrii TaxID=2724184 RepID=UPI0034451082
MLVAAFGAVGGGWLLATNLLGRYEIDAACDGLVPAGLVLALPESEGRITAPGDTLEVDGSGCGLFSDLAGDGSGRRYFFRAAAGTARTMGSNPEDPEAYLVARDLSSGRPGEADTPGPQPLGGPVDGVVTDAAVTVRLPCREGRLKGSPVKSLWAKAEIPRLRSDGPLTARDRHLLARTAVGTVNNLAERAHCGRGWEEPAEGLPADPPRSPQPAARAEGTCAFARPFAHRADFPERAFPAHADKAVSEERCLLGMGPERAGDLRYEAVHRGDYDRDFPAEPFWAALHTYYGDLADSVEFWDGDGSASAPRGTAGRGRTAVWWASSECRDGGHAVHTLSLDHLYAKSVTPAWARYFRAYVKDVAQRRGCDHLVFPGAEDFRPPKR